MYNEIYKQQNVILKPAFCAIYTQISTRKSQKPQIIGSKKTKYVMDILHVLVKVSIYNHFPDFRGLRNPSQG